MVDDNVNRSFTSLFSFIFEWKSR